MFVCILNLNFRITFLIQKHFPRITLNMILISWMIYIWFIQISNNNIYSLYPCHSQKRQRIKNETSRQMRKLREGFRAIYEEGRRKHFTALPARPAYALCWPCWLCAPPVYTLNISKYVTIKKYKIYYAYCVAAGRARNKGKKRRTSVCAVMFLLTRGAEK